MAPRTRNVTADQFATERLDHAYANGVPTPAGDKWHATQVIRVRERSSQRA